LLEGLENPLERVVQPQWVVVLMACLQIVVEAVVEVVEAVRERLWVVGAVVVEI
jgi:hypothetical protein